MLEIIYSRRAERGLYRMGRRDAARVLARIQTVAEGARADIKRLQGRPGFRLRVGDYRVILDFEDDVLRVLDIDTRGSIY